LPAVEPKHIGLGALAVLGVIGLFILGREVTQDGALGESKNPNYGHPAKRDASKSHASTSPGNMTEDQYYQGLKANRPDLSEQELRAKADHWWKVKSGEAKVTGG